MMRTSAPVQTILLSTKNDGLGAVAMSMSRASSAQVKPLSQDPQSIISIYAGKKEQFEKDIQHLKNVLAENKNERSTEFKACKELEENLEKNFFEKLGNLLGKSFRLSLNLQPQSLLAKEFVESRLQAFYESGKNISDSAKAKHFEKIRNRIIPEPKPVIPKAYPVDEKITTEEQKKEFNLRLGKEQAEREATVTLEAMLSVWGMQNWMEYCNLNLKKEGLEEKEFSVANFIEKMNSFVGILAAINHFLPESTQAGKKSVAEVQSEKLVALNKALPIYFNLRSMVNDGVVEPAKADEYAILMKKFDDLVRPSNESASSLSLRDVSILLRRNASLFLYNALTAKLKNESQRENLVKSILNLYSMTCWVEYFQHYHGDLNKNAIKLKTSNEVKENSQLKSPESENKNAPKVRVTTSGDSDNTAPAIVAVTSASISHQSSNSPSSDHNSSPSLSPKLSREMVHHDGDNAQLEKLKKQLEESKQQIEKLEKKRIELNVVIDKLRNDVLESNANKSKTMDENFALEKQVNQFKLDNVKNIAAQNDAKKQMSELSKKLADLQKVSDEKTQLLAKQKSEFDKTKEIDQKKFDAERASVLKSTKEKYLLAEQLKTSADELEKVKHQLDELLSKQATDELRIQNLQELHAQQIAAMIKDKDSALESLSHDMASMKKTYQEVLHKAAEEKAAFIQQSAAKEEKLNTQLAEVEKRMQVSTELAGKMIVDLKEAAPSKRHWGWYVFGFVVGALLTATGVGAAIGVPILVGIGTIAAGAFLAAGSVAMIGAAVTGYQNAKLPSAAERMSYSHESGITHDADADSSQNVSTSPAIKRMLSNQNSAVVAYAPRVVDPASMPASGSSISFIKQMSAANLAAAAVKSEIDTTKSIVKRSY